MVGFCPWWLWWESVRWQNPTISDDEEIFLVQSRPIGDLLKSRTGNGQYVVVIDNVLFAISGLSNCTVSTYRGFLQCTMCTLFSVMPLYLLWPCIRYNQKGDTGAYLGKKARIQGYILGEITNLEFQNHENVKKCTFHTLKQAGKNICSMGRQTHILR